MLSGSRPGNQSSADVPCGPPIMAPSRTISFKNSDSQPDEQRKQHQSEDGKNSILSTSMVGKRISKSGSSVHFQVQDERNGSQQSMGRFSFQRVASASALASGQSTSTLAATLQRALSGRRHSSSFRSKDQPAAKSGGVQLRGLRTAMGISSGEKMDRSCSQTGITSQCTIHQHRLYDPHMSMLTPLAGACNCCMWQHCQSMHTTSTCHVDVCIQHLGHHH